MTELQGSDTSTGKQVLTENTSVTDYNPKSQGGTRKELLAKYANSKDPKDAESARKAGATQTELKKAKDEVVESAKPSLKNIFNTMLSEAEQVDEKYMGFEKVKAAAKKGGAEDPGAVAASIGRKKYGKEKFQKAAAAGKKLSEAEQITIQPAKQNTQVIKQGQKTLGTVENPQLAAQIKQSIGKGEMTLAGDDELGEAKVSDARSNEIRELAKKFFGGNPYSSARIANGTKLRLSFSIPMNTRYDYFNREISDIDKKYLENLKTNFMNFMKKNGVESSEVDMKFHIGAGVYASVRINIPQNDKDVSSGQALTQSTSNKTDQDYKKLGVKFVRNKKAPWYFSGSGVSDPVGTYVPSDKQSSPEMHKLAADSFKNTINIIKGMIRSNNDQSKIDMFNKWVDFYKQKAEHHRLSATKKTDEAAMPTHDGDFGPSSGGRSKTTLEINTMKTTESKKKNDGNLANNAKPYDKVTKGDVIAGRLGKDEMGGKNKAPEKKKKTVKEGANPTEAARLLGKAHALGKDPFACKYEQGSPEAQAYLAGYKEGLDECYGSGSSDMGQDQMPAVIPGMDAMGMAPADNDFEEDVLVGKTTYGGDTDNFGFDDYEDEETMMAFESWDRQLNALLNEGKMKDIDLDMKELSDAQFKKDHGMTKSQMQKSLTSDDKKDKKTVKEASSNLEKRITARKYEGDDAYSWAVFIDGKPMVTGLTKSEIPYYKKIALEKLQDKKTVKEGVTVAINKDIENAPDSVTVTAQGDEADQLLALIKQAGMGLFGGDDQQATGSYGAPVAADTNTPALGDVGDHDSMMALIQKMTAGAQDYADEESQDDEHVHGHPDAACDTCGSAACECDSAGTAMVVGEEETEDQMEFQVAEEADSEEAETTADEDAEAEEDKALAGADSKDEEEIDEEKELTEWANDANNQRTEDDSYYEDIEFMTKVISGGLNNQKQDQTTLPHTKVTVDDLTDWKKLSGIK